MDKNNKKISKKSIILIILLSILCVILCLSCINTKAMNKSIDNALSILGENYTLTPVSAEEYEDLTLYKVMKFDVEQYDIEDIGNLSIMKVNIGVMQMATLVITPVEKDLPLMSVDYMYMLFNRMSYIEYYNLADTQDEKYNNLMTELQELNSTYSYIEDKVTEETWYTDMLDKATLHKSGGILDDENLIEMLSSNISVYCKHSKDFEKLDEEEKKEKIKITKEYSDGLVIKGGISTDIFKKELGEEKTIDFFDSVFFGTMHYN